jgi:hypothetical protein
MSIALTSSTKKGKKETKEKYNTKKKRGKH